jgi:hypothetical protein
MVAIDSPQSMTEHPLIPAWTDGRKHLIESPDEMPPDLRQVYQANQKSLEHVTTKVLLELADSDGGERTYHSLEEMPPEVRALFERLRSFRRDV